jgi:type IV pilus assembly protein PilE
MHMNAAQKPNKHTAAVLHGADRGFTLIEVMIVVAILAIIAAIAMPQYQDYVTRGRLPAAFAALADGRVKAEQWFQDNRTYVGMPCPGNTNHFNLGCASTATTYAITATGTGPMSGFVFDIDHNNTRRTTGVPSGWTANANCWIVRKGGVCS